MNVWTSLHRRAGCLRFRRQEVLNLGRVLFGTRPLEGLVHSSFSPTITAGKRTCWKTSNAARSPLARPASAIERPLAMPKGSSGASRLPFINLAANGTKYVLAACGYNLQRLIAILYPQRKPA
ncbi:hypothetical protein [Mesorhizobium sp. SARCC-RB16n]|uniref:hypothetical protein n=1 Tax=Mesorhizobium sp. SARCC-RB16n TaxID=2116687 RepID=UPI00122F23AA|nr:hypothetical protein [Mesorhizobium sp. SARCC-RB16n]